MYGEVIEMGLLIHFSLFRHEEPPKLEVSTTSMMPDGMNMIKAEKIGRECGGEMGGSGI